MALEWISSLSTGVDWQDKQHMELFNRVNKLIDAMRAGKGKEEIGDLLSFLEDYVIHHFGTEERAMEEYSYPYASAHKSEHSRFKTEIGDLKERFLEGGASSSLVILVQNRIIDWLKNHIGGTDKMLGTFMLERMKV